MELCRPIHIQSLSGARYLFILIDQLTDYTTTKLLRQKEECFDSFKDQKSWMGNLQERRIVKVMYDGGVEFFNDMFKKFSEREGLEHCISPPYKPEHNGFSERVNISILEKARCLMQQERLTDKFWAKEMSTATFLINVAPKKENSSPYEK
ncbi:hypothetical protein O181_085848 [Austropuccinia psidii MF-1]|uniref:Integrase catalytic domain-containing protein n=1 Tax=Austropuccinia psidii MF-1 TaxID=1389203 RepID=A0A9Q3FYB1_9BASI|nr:hypothetical protein [Austropuccinia psidii MF-1]